MKVLVVQHDFSVQPTGDAAGSDPKGYVRGQMVTDPAEQDEIRNAGHGHHCTATDVADEFFAAEPQPADQAKAAKASKASA